MKPLAQSLALAALLLASPAFAEIKILTNHLGYELAGPKHAVILLSGTDAATQFSSITVVDSSTHQDSFYIPRWDKAAPVDHWKDWLFIPLDFSALHGEGTFTIVCTKGAGSPNFSAAASAPFQIQPNLLERQTLSNVLYYFKAQRSSGLLDKADRHLAFDGDPSGKTADVHGGWYDATGDYGKHLSHLSFSTFHNPQQIPFTVFALFKSCESLALRGDPNFRQYKRRLLDEAMYGADYLVRVKDPDGSFYRSVGAPGGGKRAEDRRISKEGKGFSIKTLATKNKSPNEEAAAAEPLPSTAAYEVGFRNGGGMAIAALAIASTFDKGEPAYYTKPDDPPTVSPGPISGEFSNADYLKAAQDAFAFLQKHNLEYTNDGKENIVDDYCALLAATELYRATNDPQYKVVADQRAKNLIDRLPVAIEGENLGYWRADDKVAGGRPFFHAADAGLPVVALLDYINIADSPHADAALAAVKKSLQFELAVTAGGGEVYNPFGYARQIVQHKDGTHEATFFYPHDADTAPWWQGENARLASLAAAARLAAQHFKNDPAFHDQLENYATNQLNWILGLNPFDTCMLHGSGRNNPPYMFFNSYEYTNTPGGIVNGITAGYSDPHDIDFNLPFSITHKDEDWRWGEQWLPHASWYLYAISVKD